MDIKHFYIEKGQGEPLILLHGNGEDSTYFVNQIDEFSSNYRVIALDTRLLGEIQPLQSDSLPMIYWAFWTGWIFKRPIY